MDYNLNGELDKDDLFTQFRYYMAYPGILAGYGISNQETYYYWSAFDGYDLREYILYFDGSMREYGYKYASNEEYLYGDMTYQLIPITSTDDVQVIRNKVGIPDAPEVKDPKYVVYSRFFETFEFGCWAYYNPDEDEDFKFSKMFEIVPVEDGVQVFELNTKPFMI